MCVCLGTLDRSGKWGVMSVEMQTGGGSRERGLWCIYARQVLTCGPTRRITSAFLHIGDQRVEGRPAKNPLLLRSLLSLLSLLWRYLARQMRRCHYRGRHLCQCQTHKSKPIELLLRHEVPVHGI